MSYQDALRSQRLTADQGIALSDYFGNTGASSMFRDPNSEMYKNFLLRDGYGARSGAELATFLATREAREGGNGQGSQLFQQLMQPYYNQEAQFRIGGLETIDANGESSSGVNTYEIFNPITQRWEDTGTAAQFGTQSNPYGAEMRDGQWMTKQQIGGGYEDAQYDWRPVTNQELINKLNQGYLPGSLSSGIMGENYSSRSDMGHAHRLGIAPKFNYTLGSDGKYRLSQAGQEITSRLNDDSLSALKVLSVALSAAAMAPAGGAAAGGGAGAAGGAAGLGAEGLGTIAGDAFLPGALGAGGSEVAFGSLIPGLESYAVGAGAAGGMAGAGEMGAHGGFGVAGDAYMPGALNIGGSTGTSWAGLPGLASTAAGGGLASQVGGAAKNQIIKSGLGALTGGGGSGGSGGGGGLGNLGSIVGGGVDYYNQNKASGDLLAWLKERAAITDNLYKPGSPEHNLMQQEMERKDAAAGRNSQYGTRAVDLAAKIAQIKAAENTRMTVGVGGLMKDGLDQRASAPAGLMAALGANGGNIQNLSSLISSLNGSNISGTTGSWYDSLFGLGQDDSNAPGGINWGADIGDDDWDTWAGLL